jgi:isoleucyl-tRNA synthetase
MSDYTSDLKISDTIIKQMSEQYRKIRNSFRFLLANTNDLESLVDEDSYSKLDLWILERADEVFKEVENSFREYEFAKGFSLINQFVTAELSGIYLEVCKDRLYCNKKGDIKRASAQSAMAKIARSLLALCAPVLTYTVDEIIEYAPKVIKGDWSDAFDIVYEPIGKYESGLDDEYLKSVRAKFFEIVDALKKEKKIKSTLELVLYTDSKTIHSLDSSDAEDFFTVSKVMHHDEDEKLATFEVDGDKFTILLSSKAKCPRCWKYRAKDEESLCKRCQEVIG